MKPLEKIRFWLIIVWFAALIIFVGASAQAGTGFMILTQPYFWLAIVIITVLCVGAYFLLKWNMERK